MVYLQNGVSAILSHIHPGIQSFFSKEYPEIVHRFVYYFIYKYAIMCKIGL